MNTHCTIWATWFFAYELLLSLPKLRRCLIFDLFLSVFDFWRFDLVALFRLLRWCCFNVLFLSFSGHVCVIRIRYSYRNCVLLCFFTSILFLVFFSVWGFEVVFILLLNQTKKKLLCPPKPMRSLWMTVAESLFFVFFFYYLSHAHTLEMKTIRIWSTKCLCYYQLMSHFMMMIKKTNTHAQTMERRKTLNIIHIWHDKLDE